ncbi:transcription elongation factor spt5, partial [Friedmanniomyces endolithicus]
MYLRHRLSLQAQAQHPPPPSKGDRQALFKRCAETVNDPEHYLRLWFLGAPTANIKRLSVKEFYLWSFFNKGGPPGEDNSELDQYVTATEDMLGREIEPGRGEAECLRLTIDR